VIIPVKSYLDPLFKPDNHYSFYSAFAAIAKYNRNMYEKNPEQFLFSVKQLETWYSSIQGIFEAGKCDLNTMKNTLDAFIRQLEKVCGEFNRCRSQGYPMAKTDQMEDLIPKYKEFVTNINTFYNNEFGQISNYSHLETILKLGKWYRFI